MSYQWRDVNWKSFDGDLLAFRLVQSRERLQWVTCHRFSAGGLVTGAAAQVPHDERIHESAQLNRVEPSRAIVRPQPSMPKPPVLL